MMDALGLRVQRLTRRSFGPIELGDLKPGGYRELDDEEVTALEEIVGLGEGDGDR
jgi:23S rRNA pseudouridine2605 synthase